MTFIVSFLYPQERWKTCCCRRHLSPPGSVSWPRLYSALAPVYLATILPSTTADCLAGGWAEAGAALLAGAKFSLASLHIILEPVVLLVIRPELRAHLHTVIMQYTNNRGAT